MVKIFFVSTDLYDVNFIFIISNEHHSLLKITNLKEAYSHIVWSEGKALSAINPLLLGEKWSEGGPLNTPSLTQPSIGT